MTQEQKFEIEFRKLIMNEPEFKKHWIKDNIIFTHPSVAPTITKTRNLSPKAKDKLTTLINKYIDKRL